MDTVGWKQCNEGSAVEAVQWKQYNAGSTMEAVQWKQYNGSSTMEAVQWKQRRMHQALTPEADQQLYNPSEPRRVCKGDASLWFGKAQLKQHNVLQGNPTFIFRHCTYLLLPLTVVL
jgi:hypothetical protein